MRRSLIPILFAAIVACGSDTPTETTTPPPTPTTSFKNNPCTGGASVQLAVATAARIDCSAGGTTVTLAGNGASYLIVPQLPTDQSTAQLVSYTLSSGTPSASRIPASPTINASIAADVSMRGGLLPPMRNMTAQLAAERELRARTTQRVRASSFKASLMRQSNTLLRSAAPAPPAIGTIRGFRVASSFTTNTFKSVGAKLAYVGANILVYIDTLAPANGFTGSQLSDFGTLFDQTLYPIDTAAFGPPVDLDQNGRVIVLMSPVVNGDTPTATCTTQGFVAGFFDTEDFNGPADPNSNQGEIFYTIVPDPTASVSCTHTVADLGADVPATFLH
ncbi:MAG: hypothetical protein ABI625_24955, partial [bacterium]